MGFETIYNVTFIGNHAKIHGKLADYSVYLGSGVVHAEDSKLKDPSILSQLGRYEETYAYIGSRRRTGSEPDSG